MKILDCRFDPVSHEGALDWASEWLRSNKRGHVATVNVSILMAMRSSSELRDYVDKASLVVADGMPILWLSRLLGTPLPERVTGVDLVPDLCERAAREGAGVYFFGSEPGVAAKAVEVLREQIPSLKVAGCEHGYVPSERRNEVAKRIRDSGAKMLFVALGCPAQEQFIENHWDEMNVQLAVGIGSSFDFISGHKDRGPVWIRGIGLEWLFKLWCEPRRLWKRYFVCIPQFLVHASWAVVRRCVSGQNLKPNSGMSVEQ